MTWACIAWLVLAADGGPAELADVQRPEASPDAGAQAQGAPGVDRQLALSALAAARNAIEQAGSTLESREQALARLAQADALFQDARYEEAAQTADQAWKLVSAKGHEPTRFAVEVDSQGHTEVHSQTGKGVRVEADGVARQLYAGQQIKIEKGQPPPPPQVSLPVPELLSPQDEARLNQSRGGKAAAIWLVWAKVEGARAYEVRIVPTGPGKPVRLRTTRTRAVLASMPAGSYQWSVRAQFPGAKVSEASALRRFRLLDEPLKLEVGKTQWK